MIFIVLLSISMAKLAILQSLDFRPIDSGDCFQTCPARPISPVLWGNSYLALKTAPNATPPLFFPCSALDCFAQHCGSSHGLG